MLPNRPLCIRQGRVQNFHHRKGCRATTLAVLNVVALAPENGGSNCRDTHQLCLFVCLFVGIVQIVQIDINLIC
jgi:hypothetical protein